MDPRFARDRSHFPLALPNGSPPSHRPRGKFFPIGLEIRPSSWRIQAGPRGMGRGHSPSLRFNPAYCVSGNAGPQSMEQARLSSLGTDLRPVHQSTFHHQGKETCPRCPCPDRRRIRSPRWSRHGPRSSLTRSRSPRHRNRFERGDAGESRVETADRGTKHRTQTSERGRPAFRGRAI